MHTLIIIIGVGTWFSANLFILALKLQDSSGYSLGKFLAVSIRYFFFGIIIVGFYVLVGDVDWENIDTENGS